MSSHGFARALGIHYLDTNSSQINLKAVATHRIKCNSYWKYLIALASESDSTESLKIERWENGREADLSEKQGKDMKEAPTRGA